MSELLLSHALETGLVTNPPGKSLLHGEAHWKAVALTGLFISRLTGGASMPFLYVFAMLHDMCRLNDDHDPAHGERASMLFARLVMHPGVQGFGPYEPATEDMIYALAHHVGAPHARDHANLNVGICWDADRLNLWRVGVRPDPAYLTTEVGQSSGASAYSFILCEHQINGGPFPDWTAIRHTLENYRWP